MSYCRRASGTSLFGLPEDNLLTKSATFSGISKRTVDHHAQKAARKLGAKNKTHAVVLAIRYGIVTK